MSCTLLKLECIGDNWGLSQRDQFFTRLFLGGIPSRHWVAEIVGLSERYGYERRFLPCKKDYTESNSAGTRGVYAFYILHDGGLFEVQSPQSWKRCDRYFCRVENGEIVRISKEELRECLNNRSVLTYTQQRESE